MKPSPLLKRARSGMQLELDMAYLYESLAKMEKDEQIAEVFRKLSAAEQRHADHWREKFAGAENQMPTGPSLRARLLAQLARLLGPQVILPTLMETEDSIAAAQMRKREAEKGAATGLENAHSRVLRHVARSLPTGMEGGSLARLEGRHRSLGGNALRAAVLGANDGLVSNLSLVMGVAGAAVSNTGILISGIAGLLAGALSMALGEWLSVQSSRELYDRQIMIEAEELEESPEDEALELALIYQAKGVPEAQARELAARLIADKEQALDTLAREELGIDPQELGGSAWEAAFMSFGLFAVGAVIPVLPFVFTSGASAILWSLLSSSVGLFVIGAAITLFTGRSVWFSGARQMLFGLAASAVTYGIGHLFGVAIAG